MDGLARKAAGARRARLRNSNEAGPNAGVWNWKDVDSCEPCALNPRSLECRSLKRRGLKRRSPNPYGRPNSYGRHGSKGRNNS